LKTKKSPLKVHITTLGCAKNLVDSEHLMGKLKAAGLDVSHESLGKKVDIAILNTCGFIGDAKEESIDTILGFVEAKKLGQVKRLFVMGCLSQRYREDLQKEIPEVDGFFGVNEQPLLIKAIGIDLKKELMGERLLSTPKHFAYLKISEGCDRKCSFCAIPLIRGKHVSVPMEELLAEANQLANEGVKELNIIAQDTTYYGLDLYKEKKLPELLTRLSEIKGIEWIRLHYAYPLGFPMEVLDVIRENDKICKYLDIPLQHIDSGLLSAMKRGVSRKATLDLISKIREKVPGISIRTTLIVGFPGEDDIAFQKLKDFVSEARFERLGVFTYSREEDTSAFPLGDDIPEEIKRQRADEIMELQMEIAASLNEERIGQEFRVIIDREEATHYIGRTSFDSPEVDNEVIIDKKARTLEPGQFYNVEITGSDYYDLLGKVIL